MLAISRGNFKPKVRQRRLAKGVGVAGGKGVDDKEGKGVDKEKGRGELRTSTCKSNEIRGGTCAVVS